MIAYRLVDGLAQDIRLVPAGYKAEVGEIVIDGERLPSVEDLSTPEAIAARDAERNLTAKRGAAIKALEAETLSAATTDPNAPQEVKDYAAILTTKPAGS